MAGRTPRPSGKSTFAFTSQQQSFSMSDGNVCPRVSRTSEVDPFLGRSGSREVVVQQYESGPTSSTTRLPEAASRGAMFTARTSQLRRLPARVARQALVAHQLSVPRFLERRRAARPRNRVE